MGGAACASTEDGETSSQGSPKDADGGVSGDGEAAPLDTTPLAVVLPVPGDTPLATGDQAHVVDLAARPNGGVAAIVTRRNAFGAFAPGAGVDVDQIRSVVVLDGSGAVAWTKPAGRAARVIVQPNGNVVVGDLDRFREFDATGNVVREAPMHASIYGLARLGNGTVGAVTFLTADVAPTYGKPIGTYLLDAFSGTMIGPSFGDADTSSFVVDATGIGWTSSRRIAADGTASKIAIPRWEQLAARKAGGAYVTFIIGSQGCDEKCGPEVESLGEGTYRATLDANGKILGIDEGVQSYDRIVEYGGVLWSTNDTGRWDNRYALTVRADKTAVTVGSSKEISPSAIASGPNGVWVGGGFTGSIDAFGATLTDTTSCGSPFILRIPDAAALQSLRE